MSKLDKFHGKTALITGASSGIGAEFAQQFAKLGCNLVLVARRTERLNDLKRQLSEEFGIRVQVVALDLSKPEAALSLFNTTQEQHIDVDILVNNAGFGLFGKFDELDWQRELEMIQLNIHTLVQLTKLYVKPMQQRNFGHIIQIASTTAYQPTPLYASYGATKAFVLAYGEALNYEIRHSNVHCTVVSPGITRTEFFEVSGQKFTFFHKLTIKEARDVVRIAISKSARGRSSVITGWFNTLLAFSVRFSPRRLATMVGYFMMRNKDD